MQLTDLQIGKASLNNHQWFWGLINLLPALISKVSYIRYLTEHQPYNTIIHYLSEAFPNWLSEDV